MENVILSWEQYKNIINQLHEISEKLDIIESEKSSKPKAILSNEEFQIMMNISKRTAQHWRDTNLIKYSKIGNAIYYKMEDIETFLDNNAQNHEQPN